MGKKLLKTDYNYEFQVIGILCNLKCYKLAWHINKVMLWDFRTQEDIGITVKGEPMNFPVMVYENNNFNIRLIQNKISGQKKAIFIPELKAYDYILQYSGIVEIDLNPNSIIESIKSIPGIELINKVDLKKIKNKDRFFL